MTEVNETPKLHALDEAIGLYDSIAERVRELRQNIKQWQNDVKALEADMTGDAAALAKKAVSLKSKIDAAEIEISMQKARIHLASDSIAPLIQPAQSEQRGVDRDHSRQVAQAVEKLLKDPRLVEGIELLKAALHMHGDPNQVLADLGLNSKQSGYHPAEFAKHGTVIAREGTPASIDRAERILAFDAKDRRGVLQQFGSDAGYQEFAA